MMMRRRWRAASAMALAWCLRAAWPAAPAAPAAGEPTLKEAVKKTAKRDWSISADMTYSSQYIWRGAQITKDSVMQPSASVSWKGLTASLWANYELKDTNGYSNRVTEMDYTLDYTRSFRFLSLSAGVIHYRFPNLGAPHTTEIYGGASLDIPLHPSVTLYKDYRASRGKYLSLGVGQKFKDLWKPIEGVSVGLDLSASAGFADNQFNRANYGADRHGGSGWTDMLLTLGVPVTINERWTVRAFISHAALLDGGLRRSVNDADHTFAGVSVSWGF